MSRGRRLPLLTAGDFVKVVTLDGWRPVDGTKHLAFGHPTKPGKVSIDQKWDRVRRSSWVFRSVLRQAGLTTAEFEELYWRTRGK